MKNYHSLQIFKYENPTADMEAEYRNRINGPATVITNLKINCENHGERLGKEYPLFLVPINDVLKLQGVIEQNSRLIDSLTGSLPHIASNQFFFKTLVNEISSTNEIEDVKTTDKEINEAIVNAQNNKQKRTRLQSFARMYLKIKNGENLSINSLEDIRKIYDYLLDGEVPDKKLPDGKLFRNSYVRIGNETQTVHSPKTSEQEISLDLKDWISFINNDDVPPILKSFIAHYYFENIHPFNDGNGRTGRYIACVYLGYKLDPLSAITFSSETNKNKEKYYKAFQEVSNPNNYGEITFFVIEMMKIFIKGQKNLIQTMNENIQLLSYMEEKINNDKNLDKLSIALLYLYSQAFLFNDSGAGIEDRELKKYTAEFPWVRVKVRIEELVQEGILKTTKKSPLVRRITSSYIEKMRDI